jgi:hypothetical protein
MKFFDQPTAFDPLYGQVEQQGPTLSVLEPWSSPSFIPQSPHNLPKRTDPSTTTQQSGVYQPGETVSVRESYRYASLVTANLTVGALSIKFLDQPIGKRNFLSFRNASTGGQILYIEFNAAAGTNAWLLLNPGTLVLFDTVVPQDDLYTISSAAGGQLAYAYSTYPG